jgi:two-component system, response regulator
MKNRLEKRRDDMASEKTILLVEDNPDDELLTRMVFEQSRIKSKLAVARNGIDALDYLICAGGG